MKSKYLPIYPLKFHSKRLVFHNPRGEFLVQDRAVESNINNRTTASTTRAELRRLRHNTIRATLSIHCTLLHTLQKSKETKEEQRKLEKRASHACVVLFILT
jgi:hypothetical protein